MITHTQEKDLFYVVSLKPSNSIYDYNDKLVHIDTYKLYLSVRVFYCLRRPTNRGHFYLNYCNTILRFITIAKRIIILHFWRYNNSLKLPSVWEFTPELKYIKGHGKICYFGLWKGPKIPRKWCDYSFWFCDLFIF